MSEFRIGHAAADDWRDAVDRCLAALGVNELGNLGFLYVTDGLAEHMDEVLARFREATGVQHWVGTLGLGICATGVEYYEQPAVAAMVGEFPDGSFQVFPAVVEGADVLTARDAGWGAERAPYLGLVHADPANPRTEAIVKQLAGCTSSGFLLGGLASSRGKVHSFADGIVDGGVSGVLFSEEVGVVTRLSQGCSPIGPQRSVTKSQRNIMIELDGGPALDALKLDIGELLARDLTKIGGQIFAGLPIAGSDTGDYLVRNLAGLDPGRGLVAIGDMVEEGAQVMFCRRDAETAREDMVRMLGAVKKALGGPPRGGIYVSCLGRGANLFGPNSEELKLIASELGDFPLVGFFANGEISQDRVYGYTGVLMLFP